MATLRTTERGKVKIEIDSGLMYRQAQRLLNLTPDTRVLKQSGLVTVPLEDTISRTHLFPCRELEVSSSKRC